jgi:hypothetical protein
MTNMEDLEALAGEGIPVLEGWMSLPAVGDALRVTRQRVYQMGAERKFKTIRKIPGAAPTDPARRPRPMGYVVATWEVEELQAAQRAAIAADGDAVQMAEAGSAAE